MTYHPKQIMMCALFLATKSDHWHISLHKFASRIGNTTEEDVKAPEFLLMQGLRFMLDVRHPMRGLEGGVGELLAFIEDGTLFEDETDKRAAQKKSRGCCRAGEQHSSDRSADDRCLLPVHAVADLVGSPSSG